MMFLRAFSAIAICGLGAMPARAQGVCSNSVFPYRGPGNSVELEALLYTSPNPALAALDDSTKQSLIQHIVFEDGICRGMEGSDVHIQALYAGNAAEVLAAILDRPVLLFEAESAPTFHPITRSELLSIAAGGANVWASWCSNCYRRSCSDTCCTVGGTGCADSIAEIAGDFFRVTDQAGCAAYAPPCPGDATGDARVNLSDLSILLSSFGAPGSASDGDADGNGFIDLIDLSIVLGVFGSNC